MNCSGTWWLCNPRPPLATAAHHHRCLLDPVLCCCGAEGPPQPPASYGATWWPNVAQNPFTRVPSHHYHQRPIKRGRSPERGFSCYYRAQGPPMCLAAPNDRRVWYNAERRLKRRPQPLLPARRWIELNDSSSSPSVSSDASQDRFILLSYNVLGDDNASNHGDMYANIPSDIMRWQSRKHLICQEICRWSADIVCLQEVDRYNDILTNLKKKGYAGSYKRRTGEAKDGCAVFWEEKRFHLLEADTIEFSAFGLRDNVAQLFVFELCEASSRRLIVGNIHVLFNPKRGDIKLGQVRILLSKADALSEKWGGIPVVLAGDFNSTPQSAIYEFLSNSKLNITAHDRRDLSGQVESLQYGIPRFLNYCWTNEELKNATGNSNCTKLIHPLELRSSYATVKSNALTRGPCGEPLATTCHSKFIGTVDYLWYSSGLVSTRVLDTLPVGTLKRLGGLPSKEIGSDHLALASEFFFT